ncbi:YidC/Oxa1 family membrane protein insertase [Actinomadura litoris]|uniref:YidC/Oxa1 family membrane protein insertase n=1 Tax=Actinomadura litoris TaxID=2678616 RepID=UPI001FA7BB69|nr:YidC/Oxa1 family membrane protein insertase [Actinomadura litoris]
MFLLDTPVSLAHDLVTGLAEALRPLAGASSTAAAIIVFTAAARLVMLPLAIAAARGERAREGLLPQLRALQRKHAKDPRRLRAETAALYRDEGVAPAAGCLPMFAQWPVFMVLYRLFVSATVAGHQNLLLAHTLLGAPLGQTWVGLLGGGLLAPHSLVFLGLFVLLAAVATWTSRRVTAEGPMAAVMRVLPFGTVVFAAFVPLAAGLYLLTSGTWTAAERAVLRRRAAVAV